MNCDAWRLRSCGGDASYPSCGRGHGQTLCPLRSLKCVILAKEFLWKPLFLQPLPRFRFCLGDTNSIAAAGGHDAIDRDNLNKGNNASSDRNPRSDHDRRTAHIERSEEEKFLHGKGRFKRHSEFVKSISAAGRDLVAASKMPANRSETRSGHERRSGQDRRCGFDTPSGKTQVRHRSTFTQ